MDKLNELKELVTALRQKSVREGCSVHDIGDFARKALALIDEVDAEHQQSEEFRTVRVEIPEPYRSSISDQPDEEDDSASGDENGMPYGAGIRRNK